MQVNVTNTNGIIAELQVQRNEALNQNAVKAGQVAELQAALAAANKRIKELEADLKPEDANVV